MAKIITAEEMAAHYAPLLDLYGALKEVERLEAENERLREDLAFTEKALVKADEVVKHVIRLVEVYERAALGDTK